MIWNSRKNSNGGSASVSRVLSAAAWLDPCTAGENHSSRIYITVNLRPPSHLTALRRNKQPTRSGPLNAIADSRIRADHPKPETYLALLPVGFASFHPHKVPGTSQDSSLWHYPYLAIAQRAKADPGRYPVRHPVELGLSSCRAILRRDKRFSDTEPSFQF